MIVDETSPAPASSVCASYPLHGLVLMLFTCGGPAVSVGLTLKEHVEETPKKTGWLGTANTDLSFADFFRQSDPSDMQRKNKHTRQKTHASPDTRQKERVFQHSHSRSSKKQYRHAKKPRTKTKALRKHRDATHNLKLRHVEIGLDDAVRPCQNLALLYGKGP